jgi:membrane protein
MALTRSDAVARARGLVERAESSLPGRCATRFRSIDGRDRTLALAGQAFTALVPLLIVAAAFTADDAVARGMVERFRLEGQAADAVRLLFSRPPGMTGTLTLAGMVVLFYSALSFTRALQRTWEAAWELPRVGFRGTLHALAGFGLLMAQIVALVLLTDLMQGWPGADITGAGVRLLLAVVLWLELQYRLLSRRVPRRMLVPGAVVAGAGQLAASIYSAVWMPRLIEVNARRYGVIGVTFAVVTWLIVICLGIVAAAVVSAEVGRTRALGAALAGRGTSAATGPASVAPATGPAVAPAAVAPADVAPAPPAGSVPPTPWVPPAPRPPRPPRAARAGAALRADRTDRFGLVLVLVLTTVGWTAAAPDEGWARALVALLQTATLFAALRASLAGRRVVTTAAVLWAAGLVLGAAGAVAGSGAHGFGAALGLVLMGAALAAVLRRLARQPEVSAATVAGAISAYLLLGLVFTFAYALLGAVGPEPLTGGDGGEMRLNEHLYFAFTTLTTTGFGDLTPVTDVARAVTILEALLGQLYLVTVLALAVARLRPARPRPPAPDEAAPRPRSDDGLSHP